MLCKAAPFKGGKLHALAPCMTKLLLKVITLGQASIALVMKKHEEVERERERERERESDSDSDEL